MSTVRHTLRAFSTPQQACGAIDTLYADYKRAHKRGATISLCYSLTSVPDPTAEKTYYKRDVHSVTIHADSPSQAAEVTWFTQAAQSL